MLTREWTPSVNVAKRDGTLAGQLDPKGEGGRIDEETPKGKNGTRA
jgi:hypothetical protein